MKKTFKFLVISLLALVSGILLVSCGETAKDKDTNTGSTTTDTTDTPQGEKNYSLTQVTAENVEKTFDFKALVLNFNPSKSGNSRNIFLADKDLQGSALVHLRKGNFDQEFKIGNYVQFKGKVVFYSPNEKTNIIQVQVEGDVKVLESNVTLPENMVVTTLAQINDKQNEHKIVNINNVKVVEKIVKEKKYLSLEIDGKNVNFTLFGDLQYTPGDVFNLKNVVISQAGAKYGKIIFYGFSSAEKVSSASEQPQAEPNSTPEQPNTGDQGSSQGNTGSDNSSSSNTGSEDNSTGSQGEQTEPSNGGSGTSSPAPAPNNDQGQDGTVQPSENQDSGEASGSTDDAQPQPSENQDSGEASGSTDAAQPQPSEQPASN